MDEGFSELQVVIDGRPVGPRHPPYVIAELSANHNGELQRALRLVDAVAEAGADAVKLQTFRPESMTLDVDAPGFTVQEGLWAGRRLIDLYRTGQTPAEWHAPIFQRAREQGLHAFSAPFDVEAVRLLDELGAPALKIASPELVHLPLIRTAAATKRPLIMSTGMATLDEIEEAVGAARASGADEIVLLHCVASYPAPLTDLRLKLIPELVAHFQVPVGFSDHSMGTDAAVAAVALGAVAVEKHVCLSREEGGIDSAFSLEPDELARLVQGARVAWEAAGGGQPPREPGPAPSEAQSLRVRRSIFATQDIEAGGHFTADNVAVLRPAMGLHPREYERVVKSSATRRIRRGEPLSFDLLENGDA